MATRYESAPGIPSVTKADLSRVPADNIFQLYLAEVSRHPILTREQEQELVMNIKTGVDAEASTELLIASNQRLMIRLAKKFTGSGVPIMDLIQAGNVGMTKAIRTYEPDSGKRFTTYAGKCAKNEMRYTIRENKIFSMPYDAAVEISKINSYTHIFQDKHERKPTPIEIAAGLSMQPARVELLMQSMVKDISLDDPDIFIKQSSEDHMDLRHRSEKTDHENLVRQLLDKLKPEHKELIMKRIGLDGGEPQTLETIAQREDITHQAVRDREQKILGRLRRIILYDPRFKDLLELI